MRADAGAGLPAVLDARPQVGRMTGRNNQALFGALGVGGTHFNKKVNALCWGKQQHLAAWVEERRSGDGTDRVWQAVKQANAQLESRFYGEPLWERCCTVRVPPMGAQRRAWGCTMRFESHHMKGRAAGRGWGACMLGCLRDWPREYTRARYRPRQRACRCGGTAAFALKRLPVGGPAPPRGPLDPAAGLQERDGVRPRDEQFVPCGLSWPGADAGGPSPQPGGVGRRAAALSRRGRGAAAGRCSGQRRGGVVCVGAWRHPRWCHQQKEEVGCWGPPAATADKAKQDAKQAGNELASR